MKTDEIYLRHILDAINKIRKYTDKVDEDKFKSEEIIQDAVIRKLEIIGEAVKLIDKKTKNKKTELPWKDIAGMRDKLIHNYFGVDLDAVWLTLTKDLDQLKEGIKEILNNE